jgi:hypothetical protein
MKWVALIILILVVVGFGADRLLLWMEQRGWLDYRLTAPKPRDVGKAILGVHGLLEPEKRHAYEMQVEQELKQERDDEGGPGPLPGA